MCETEGEGVVGSECHRGGRVGGIVNYSNDDVVGAVRVYSPKADMQKYMIQTHATLFFI